MILDNVVSEMEYHQLTVVDEGDPGQERSLEPDPSQERSLEPDRSLERSQERSQERSLDQSLDRKEGNYFI